MNSGEAAADQLDDDMLRGPIAQGDADIAELAQKRFLAGNLLDDGRLAKAEFAQPSADLRLSLELANAAGSSDREVGKPHASRAERVTVHRGSLVKLNETHFQ